MILCHYLNVFPKILTLSLRSSKLVNARLGVHDTVFSSVIGAWTVVCCCRKIKSILVSLINHKLLQLLYHTFNCPSMYKFFESKVTCRGTKNTYVHQYLPTAHLTSWTDNQWQHPVDSNEFNWHYVTQAATARNKKLRKFYNLNK